MNEYSDIPASDPAGLSKQTPRLYDELASWFHLLTAPVDYEEEAELYRRILVEVSPTQISTLLELGSGGGNNASHLKKHFEMTLTDLSPAMLALSQTLNPECEHVAGDMRSLRLGKQFDAVFVQDAIAYITTLEDLSKAAETAFVHCKPGGIALFVPDKVRESFQPSTDCGGHDGEGRGLRYLEWIWDPDPTDSSYIVDFAYLLRESDGAVRVVRDRHIHGLFSRDEWLGVLRQVGFIASRVPIEHSELEPGTYEGFVCVKPD